MEISMLDTAWVLLCAGLVFLMQAGFMCLESGLTRAKNNINVAIKNLTDFGISVVLFWACGFALMFGASSDGWIGTTSFLPSMDRQGGWLAVFFVFEVMFCATATTIVSGAIAERVRFKGYIVLTALISALIYPIFGHWAWNGLRSGSPTGWLEQQGFVDFAGSTVVHSLGGWFALATVLILGSRAGRFPPGGVPRKITGSNLPMSMLGVVLLWLGWFGFNGGSAFAVTSRVAGIIMHTVLAGSAGALAALAIGWPLKRRPEVTLLINGSMAGLVAITASVHAVSAIAAVVIGGIGGIVMLGVDHLLERLRIDDAVGAIPVHLGAGIWGTLAVALWGNSELLATGLDRGAQLRVQLLGIAVCGVWTFGVGYLMLWTINRFLPLRVTPETERIGLNVAEHGASTELLDLFMAMDQQAKTGDLSLQAPVEPFTEVGQIADRYNRVMEALREVVARTEAIVSTATDAIITFAKPGLAVSTVNPSTEVIFGYQENQLIGKSLGFLLGTQENKPDASAPEGMDSLLPTLLTGGRREVVGRRVDGSTFPMEVVMTEAELGEESFYSGIFHDITERKRTEEELRHYKEHLEEQVGERTAALTKANTQLQREIVERRRAEAALLQAKEACEAANRAKSAFLGNMSHELRTPLNAIIGFSEVLLDQIFGTLDAKQEEYLTDILTSGTHLHSLISDMLDLTRIEAGMLELQRGAFDFRQLLEGSLVLVEERALTHSIALSLEIADDIDPVIGDERRVKQILFNLLSNAVKFTPDHGKVGLKAHRAGEVVQIAVWDTGVGIAPEDQQRIFEGFQQVGEGLTGKTEGTGLGLTLTKKFVELHGGTVRVESSPDRGSTFTFTLPLPGAADRPSGVSQKP